MSDAIDAWSRQLRDESYTVMPGLYAPDRVADLRAVMERLYRDLGSPPPYGQGVRWIAENLEVSSTGFVIHKLLGFTRALHHGLLPREAVEVVRRVLGADMHLEMVGGVISDHTRPFFEWHMHVGGIDDEAYRRNGLRPTFTSPQRVAMLVYLDEMRAESGQLLVYPRKVTDPIDPPFPVGQTHWDGEVAVVGPPGTVVMLEQSTWHAVRPSSIEDSLRMFVGFWFAAADATAAQRVDESLYALESPDELLVSVLPRRRDA